MRTKMKNTFLCFFIIPILLLLVGCKSKKVSNFQIENDTTLSVFPTESSTATTIPSTLTPKAAPEIIPTATPGTKIIKNCSTVLSSMPDNNYLGTVVLLERAEYSSIYFLLDLAKIKKTTLDSNIISLAVSPDGKHFAYEKYKKHELNLYSADNQFLASYDWKENWLALTRWQNNQSVIIYKTDEIKVTPSLAVPLRDDYPRTLILFDPFSNQEQILAPDYPGIDLASPALGWDDSGTTIFNYQLTQVVYPGSAISGMGFILWDIPTSKVVVMMDDPSFGDPAKWTQDGSKFMILGLEDELYIVTNKGEISQITKLNHGDYRYRPEYYNWSPDGQYVAMWLNDRETSSGNFVILDTHSREITDYCISMENYVAGYVETIAPIWAQNGKAVVIEARLEGEENGKTALLLDLENNLAIRLADDAIPIGWLDSQD